MVGSVEGLRVFRLAYQVSLEVHRASLSWPKVEQYGGIANQIRRSSKSVCALLSEGVGRQSASKAEFARYLTMAIGSSDESRLWCQYAEDLGYVAPEQAQTWRTTFEEVSRMLNGLRSRQHDDNQHFLSDP